MPSRITAMLRRFVSGILLSLLPIAVPASEIGVDHESIFHQFSVG